MPPGSLAIPVVFAGHSPQAVSTLDNDLSTIAAYINAREVTLGALSARPAAGNSGAWYVATDTNGGTLYVDNGSTWVQVAVGVTATRAGEYCVRGLVGNNTPATPNTKYDLTSADLVQLRNPTDGTIIVKTAVGLFTCDTGLAGSAINGRDQAGAFNASTWIHFYYACKADGTGLGALASTTAPPTGPALPTGYTHWAYAGAVFNNVTPLLVKTRMRGAKVFYEAQQAALSGGAATVETAVSLTTFIPPNAVSYRAHLTFLNATNAVSSTTIRIVTGVTYLGISQTVAVANSGVATVASVDFPNIGQSLFYINSAAGDATGINIEGYTIPNGGE